MPPKDGIQRVFCFLIVRTDSSFHADDRDIIHQDIDAGVEIVPLVHNVDVGDPGEVADDQNGGIRGRDKFLSDLEPSILQIPCCRSGKRKITPGLQNRVALHKNETVCKPKTDIPQIRASGTKLSAVAGAGDLQADAVAFSGFKGTQQHSLPILAVDCLAAGGYDLKVPVTGGGRKSGEVTRRKSPA